MILSFTGPSPPLMFQSCIDLVKEWMTSDDLKLNGDKRDSFFPKKSRSIVGIPSATQFDVQM